MAGQRLAGEGETEQATTVKSRSYPHFKRGGRRCGVFIPLVSLSPPLLARRRCRSRGGLGRLAVQGDAQAGIVIGQVAGETAAVRRAAAGLACGLGARRGGGTGEEVLFGPENLGIEAALEFLGHGLDFLVRLDAVEFDGLRDPAARSR